HARAAAWRLELTHTYSPPEVEALLRTFVTTSTWQVPTFPIMLQLCFVTPKTNLLRDMRMRYVPQNVKRIWFQGVQAQLENYSEADLALREEIVKRSLEIVGKMQANGVRIMAGTDIAAP